MELEREASLRTLLARLLGQRTVSERWRKGARGEEMVGRRLARLGPGWRVLHAVPMRAGTSDIDHVVIGPGGVFTINTKNHIGCLVRAGRGGVWVNRRPTDYVSQALAEARIASAALSGATGLAVATRPILAVLASRVQVSRQPGEVVVLRLGDMPRWFLRQAHVLSPMSVDRLFGAARQRSTWR